MASEAQKEFYARLAEEREMEVPAYFAELSVEDASAEIDLLLKAVETGPVTEEQLSEITDLLAVVGPRRDGNEWQIPDNRGHAAAFIRNLRKWKRGAEYGARQDAARERLVAAGVAVKSNEFAPADPEADSIPF